MSAPRKFDQEMRDRAVRMYRDRLEQHQESRLAARRQLRALLDSNAATIRNWVDGDLQHPRGRGADRDNRDRVCVACVGLAVVPGVEQPDPGSELGRYVDHVFAVFEESLRRGRPAPLVASTAHTWPGHPATYLRIAV